MPKFLTTVFELVLFIIKGAWNILISLFSRNNFDPHKKNDYDFPKYKKQECQYKTSIPTKTYPKKSEYSGESLLDLARENEFKAESLLNQLERSMFYGLISNINNKQYAVFPQASCGEMFSSKDGHKSINSKRADFCIVDKKDYFKPVSLIEVHGSGHHLRGSGNTVIRDATLKEVCMKSGVKYHEYRPDIEKDISKWILEELSYLVEGTK